MVIRYPNGQIYREPESPKSKNKLTGSKTDPIQKLQKRRNHSNRGMKLEELINSSIEYYRQQEIAVIHKKPTPVQIVNVDYPKRSAAKITEAYFRRASTTDYNGVYKGHYLDFEAKETKYKTSFPLQNFHDHQINHMQACERQGGIVFVIIYFSTLNRCFLLEGKDLFNSWVTYQRGGRKSIPFQTVEDKGHEIEFSYQPTVPFIDIVDKLL